MLCGAVSHQKLVYNSIDLNSMIIVLIKYLKATKSKYYRHIVNNIVAFNVIYFLKKVLSFINKSTLQI